MKWIGQHIYDFISRFRNDVYLEDISTGTIASGGNLGLDSNNKIVKADTEAGELTIANASDNRIVTSLGGTDLNAEANLTFNGSIFAMSSITATISDSSVGPIFTIQNTGNNSYGGGLVLENTRGGNDASDNDTLGIVSFAGKDDGVPSNTYYGDIVCTATDVTSDQEKGEMKLRVASYDGVRENGLLLAGTDTDGEVDVTIGSGAASLTTIAGTLTMGSTAFVNNSGVVQVATQGTIDHDSLANFVANEHLRWDNDVSGTATIHTNNITDLHGAGVDGSANQLLTDDGDGTVTSESALTFSTNKLTAGAGTTHYVSMGGTWSSGHPSAITNAVGSNILLGGFAVFTTAIPSMIKFGNAGTFDQAAAYIEGAHAAGTDKQGGDLIIVGGASTGDNASGGFKFWGDAGGGGSDSNVNAPTEKFSISGSGVVTTTNNIELGHASDTTIARSAAGTVTIEGEQVFTTKVPDLTSGSAGVPAVIMHTRRTITTAEANSMNTTPIELVPAQGANTVIIPIGGMIRVDRAATQTNSAADLNMHYAGLAPGLFFSTSVVHGRRFMWNETGDRVFNITAMMSAQEVAQNLTSDANKALQVSFDSATTTDCFTSIDIFLTYQVISIA